MSDAKAAEPEIDLNAVKADARVFAESRAALGDEKWLKEMEAYLTLEDEDSRYAAVNEIMRWECPPYETVALWTEAVRPAVREMACYLLGWEEIGTGIIYPQAILVLLPMLNDSDIGVRSCAVWSVSNHKFPDCLSALLKMVGDASEDVRLAVARGLGSFYEAYWDEYGEQNKPATQTALLRLMDDEDEDVRDWATFGIHQGSHDTPESRARLWKALDDPFFEVRGEAAAGFGAIFDDRSFIPKLAELLLNDASCPLHYFDAAETFNDPVLLPAVLEAAEGWRESLEEGEKLPYQIVSALKKCQQADSDPAPQNAVNSDIPFSEAGD